MSLNQQDIQRVAQLARIRLDGQELDATLGQINGILGFITQLQAVNTVSIEPMAHAVDVVQRLREDVVTEADRRSDFQALAPDAEAGLYLVPKVIE